MDRAELADREQLDQATNLLMASLRESKALNIGLREAFQRQQQAHAAVPPKLPEQSGPSVFEVLRDVIDGTSHQ